MEVVASEASLIILYPMKVFLLKFLAGLVLFPLLTFAADSPFEGKWRMVPDRSSALDGWTAMDLSIAIDGSEVEVTHDMRWRSTRVLESNTFDTENPVEIEDFFRIEQRHMAVYPEKGEATKASAVWLDKGKTLRVEAEVPVEVSQGTATIRIYSEYRIAEGGQGLTLIELHSTRNNPLVYRFSKLADDDTSRP